MKKFITSLCLALPVMCLGQFHLRPTGQVALGNSPDSTSCTYKPALELYGDAPVQPAISFGPQGEYYHPEQLIASTSDKLLWFRSKGGFYFSTVSASGGHTALVRYEPGKVYDLFRIHARVYGKAFVTTLTPATTPAAQAYSNTFALDALSQLEVVQGEVPAVALSDGEVTAENDAAYMPLTFSPATMVENFPELIVGEGDEYYANLQGLIPVLVKAVQELSAEVASLRGQQGAPSQVSTLSLGSTVVNGNSLSQNTPNPFSASSVIRYTLSDAASVAHINIYDMQGSQIDSYTVAAQAGAAALTIEAGRYAPGMYLYALIVDGAEIDCKRMIVTD